MKKENSIVIWRIVFTYMIVAFHFDTTFPWMNDAGFVSGWYLAVEFFFLVSGYLIFAKFEESRERYGYTLRFMLHRYAQIWPKYILSFILTFCAIMLLGKNKLPAIPLLWDSKFEIALLQGIGLDRGWDYINPTLWYLSVMMIASFLIFFMLKYMRRFFVGYLAPAMIILFLFVIYVKRGALDVAVMDPGEVVNFPLFRGIAEMCLGMYACMLTDWFINHGSELLWKCIGSACMLVAILLATYLGHSGFDYLILILLFVGVSAGFLPSDEMDPVIARWSDMTLDIYLLHELFRMHIFPHFFSRDVGLGRKLLYMLLYMIAVSMAAMLMNLIFSKVGQLWKKDER
ncbi:MAG: acyltransferase family protein [Lachnospiraceae bacterium]|nr:acyltransferase family protein [Lachnospiraceae bacterium]